MKAIITTFTPDQAHNPAITAECMGKRVTVPYDRALSLDDNHVQAALTLAWTLGWAFDWTYGLLPSGDYCHVAETGKRQFTTRPTEGTRSPPEYWRGGIRRGARA